MQFFRDRLNGKGNDDAVGDSNRSGFHTTLEGMKRTFVSFMKDKT